jgi:hypothetical protein
MKRKRTKLVKAHSTELAKVEGELNQETRNYTNYRLIMHHHLHHLHETVASIFDEVRV